MLTYFRSAVLVVLTLIALASLCGLVLFRNLYSVRIAEFERDDGRNVLVGLVHIDTHATKIVLQYWAEPINPASRGRVVYSRGRYVLAHTPPAPAWGKSYGTIELSSPLWPVLVVSGLYPGFELLIGVRRRRRRTRQRAGLCVKCGYDLRGSTLRCPECAQPFTSEAQNGNVTSTVLARRIRQPRKAYMLTFVGGTVVLVLDVVCPYFSRFDPVPFGVPVAAWIVMLVVVAWYDDEALRGWRTWWFVGIPSIYLGVLGGWYAFRPPTMFAPDRCFAAVVFAYLPVLIMYVVARWVIVGLLNKYRRFARPDEC